MANGDDYGGTDRNAVMLGVRAIERVGRAIEQAFPQTIGVSGTATGGGATLPANPAGFLVLINPATGDTVKVPYYDD